ncbi:MAG TPA: DpnD/PcfM family protein [Saprospiraceae bacterium]|nr:DpnD/PcfM family protein [Saprospiraceae bacterium]HRO08498.1 DpnD/PcfM family protein [Saprospiraceae bacterium]HRP41884.1 DpnD/PcfM family protein [Saprospiraceae bacterium]
MEIKKYKIEIQEFLSRIIEIEAENIDEAVSKAKKMYRNEEIVLDSEDYVTTEIEEYNE